jgi:type I restriction enzyme S subunit
MKWQSIQLGEVLDVKHGYAFKSQFFSNEGTYVLLTPGNCHETGGLKLKGDKEKYYIAGFPDEFLLKAGDMLVVMTDLINTAPILGGSFLIPEDNRYLHNQRLGRVQILDQRRIDPTFLYYLLNTQNYRGQVRGSASGATVRHTSPARIKQCIVRVPVDLSYQRQIGAILAAYDNLIENNTRRMALLEQAARLLYEEWFVRLRFPGREHTRIIDGVPEGWGRQRLASLADINRESLRSGHDGEIEYVDISSVTPGQINATETYNFRDAPSRARRVVRHGDIIWSCVRPNRRSHAVVWNPPSNLIVSTGFVTISPSVIPTTFLYFATTTNEFVGYLDNRARGAAYPAVLAADFQQAEILVPPQKLTAAFDDFTSPILSQAQTLRTQNTKLVSARDLLLPRLITGEIKA